VAGAAEVVTVADDGEQVEVVVDELVVEFVHDGYAIRPLDGLSFEGRRGELIVLLGPSGSGKTTLLSCLGGILSPTSGTIRVGDAAVTALRGRQLDRYRREQIGFVFQAFNLIPSLSARENVAVPLMLTGVPRHDAMTRADELLELVGLADRGAHKPAKLSGGQQQRVAVARGLGHDPPVLLADEPTANLDHVQAEAIITLLRGLRSEGRVIIVSTHDARLVPIADRIVEMVPRADGDGVDAERAEVALAAGATLFEQEDASDYIYVIDEGEIDIVRVLADGTEERLERLGPGQYFGELGPLLGFRRSASARAATDARLTAYSPRAFRDRTLHS
jgi:putative ABC transport system ATP-binding protein